MVNNFRAQGRFYFTRNSGYTGYDVADFLVGKFGRFIQGVGEFKNTRFHIINFFFNDAMKVSRRLTLDLGVRWEPFLPNTDVLGKLAIWRGGDAQSTRFDNAPPGVLYARDPGVPEGGYATTWRNFGPRIGLAYDLTGDGKTSLRAGYGIFFDRLNTFRGPGSFNVDFGLHKDFPMGERLKWQFRFESFNLFNNVNLRNPNGTVTSGNFMKITSADDPRILQFALRLEY